MTRKVIVTCAVTGSIHTPSMSSHLPVAADKANDTLLFKGSDAVAFR